LCHDNLHRARTMSEAVDEHAPLCAVDVASLAAVAAQGQTS